MPSSEAPLKVMFLGTYDLSKPRNRILLRGLRESGAELTECHEPVWEAIRDKGTLSKRQLAGHLLRALRGYSRLGFRFLLAEKPDVVWIGYLGQLDVIALAPLARLFGVPVVWDQFISLYDTVVDDRALTTASGVIGRAIYAWEWLACRSANLVLMDTRAHADYVAVKYGLEAEKVDYVWVGAEIDQFPPAHPAVVRVQGPVLEVLFYGQFIPLHGIETIVRAARSLLGEPVHFTIIGTGQEEGRIRELLAEHPLSNVVWEPWVDYGELIRFIHRADVCLGVFGTSGKAGRVIPNKVFQIVAAQRPLITRQSEAIRELFDGSEAGVWLVPAGDAEALADRLRILAAERGSLPCSPHAALAELISPRAIGQRALTVLRGVVGGARRGGS